MINLIHFRATMTIKKRIVRTWRRAYSHGGGTSELDGAVAAAIAYGTGESVFVHDPIGLQPLGRPPLVEHKRLFDPNGAAIPFLAREDRLVSPGRFPVPRHRRPVRPGSVWVLAIPRAEEVPLSVPKQRFGCADLVRVSKHVESTPD